MGGRGSETTSRISGLKSFVGKTVARALAQRVELFGGKSVVVFLLAGRGQSRIASVFNSINAVSFSSARTTKCPQYSVIRVYDAAGNLIETHERKDEFKEW